MTPLSFHADSTELNSLDDVLVAGTAAQIAFEQFANF
jgi:hypothetical protein